MRSLRSSVSSSSGSGGAAGVVTVMRGSGECQMMGRPSLYQGKMPML